jgi:predicted transposase YdaD
LLPLAALARAEHPVELLKKVLDRIAQIPSADERRETEVRTHLLAGLRFDQKLLSNLFREEVMQESVTYRAILQKGETKGRLEGRMEGLIEGRQEEAQTLLLKMIGKRFGEVSDSLKSKLLDLTLVQTEELALTFYQLEDQADLTRWLKKHTANGI